MIVMSSCTATAPTSRTPASFSNAGSRRSAVPTPGGARAGSEFVLIGVSYRRDPERLLSRVRLSVTVPELRARFLVEQANGVELLAPLLARKRGARTDDLRLRVIGSSLLAAVSVALDLWQKDSGKSDLLALLDQATDALADAMGELQPSPRRRNPPAKPRSSRR